MPYAFNVFTGTLDYYQSQSGTSGVFGVPPTTPGAIASWANTSGSLIQNTLTNVQNSGAIEAQGFITERNVNGTVTVNSSETWIAPALTLQPGANIIIQPGGELLII
jgi:hypothetical protein